ncbi:hypothetical protein M408DRAFT_329488 [Serendipita vermifera MAFF 305830]|uniref:Uncharacterized protein n=1 Tax=Serendipita vermifera MAFF 305830 TaxID=933852 RepID=A0A0C2XH37_SERVB|nr:hypothetical protein M408DRAFT_329488 [Serendipita vermifera MAFF 305830]
MSSSGSSSTATITDAFASVASSGSSPRVGGGDLPFIIFPLDRNLRISQFPTPRPEPLQAYRPQYTTLADGSLLTAVYKADLFSANSRLFGVGALLTLGAINVWTCVSYIRRGRVKDKTLFYLLLASQVLLPLCFSALLAPFFLDNVDCTIVNIVAVLSTELSYTILITGILGLKAYRCLSRSRFILVVVWVLQLSIWVLFALDIRGINSPRRISGSCGTDGSLKFIPIALVLTVVETLFLALCFLYAVWKSTLYPAAQGRLSIALSEKAPADDPRDDTIRRGWWDYVPRAPASEVGSIRGPNRPSESAHGHTTRPSNDDSLVKRLRNSVMRLTTSIDLQQHHHQTTLGGPLEPQTFTRKPSLPTEYPLSQPPRPRHQPQPSQVFSLSEKDRPAPRHSMARMSKEVVPSGRATSVRSINFAPSQLPSQRSSRVDPLHPGPSGQEYEEGNVLAALESLSGKRLPAVLQVRAVIRDEMVYSFVITVSCIVAVVISFWRAKDNDVAFGPSIWLGANWAAISLLVMRTFSKVVQRHEREAILQSPSAYGGPLLSRNDFSPNIAAIALARRRRDALALARNGSSAQSTGQQGQQAQSQAAAAARRRKLARRSSWDYATGVNYTPSLFEDDASIRRREGLRAYDEEKERQRQRHELQDANPFADFNEISPVDIFDVEHGDIGRRKSAEGAFPFSSEEMMLQQQPMIASPWNENPFAYVDFGPSNHSPITGSDAGRDLILSDRRRSTSLRRSVSPFNTGVGRRGSAVSATSSEDRDRSRHLQPFAQMTGISTNATFSRAGPIMVGTGARRGALVGQEVYVPQTTLSTVTPSPSPPQSRNGSAIELLEQPLQSKQ